MEFPGALVTITEVEAQKDLEDADVFISVLPSEKTAEVMGELKKNVKVAAYQFSEKAKEKLKDCMSIEDLMKKNPEGKKVRIIG